MGNMDNVVIFNKANFYPGDPYRVGDEVYIWGIKSRDDISSQNPSFYTMNDLVLTYNEAKQLYSVSVESIYLFESKADELAYLSGLLSEFTNWMTEKGYRIDAQPSICDVFGGQQQFVDIPDAYAWFKFTVEAYVNKNK